MGGMLEQQSNRFLRQWKYSLKLNASLFPGDEARFANSVKGFKVYVGNAFYVEKETMLKIAHVVVNSTVTLILL